MLLLTFMVFLESGFASPEVGLSTDKHVEVVATSIPFLVSIQLQTNGNLSRHQCFGTIIHEEIILTAAHCFQRSQNPSDYKALLCNEESCNKSLRISQIVKHFKYYPLKGHDIALAKLAEPLKLGKNNLHKIDYRSNKNLDPNITAYVIASNSACNKSCNMSLKFIPHRIIDNEKCSQRKFPVLTESEVCAVAYGSAGPCEGDSGSPLVISEMNLQLGILSYSRSICKPNRIYVFTRIKPFLEWIKATMNKLLREGKDHTTLSSTLTYLKEV
ncbi:tryptase-2-like isoform X1 [Musca autumnalis]|uniref:tryptase-2-like isoform X1 n=1 Tax=Musca autumnalis TaxID=221902 RepID=UPI003CF28F8F